MDVVANVFQPFCLEPSGQYGGQGRKDDTFLEKGGGRLGYCQVGGLRAVAEAGVTIKLVRPKRGVTG